MRQDEQDGLDEKKHNQPFFAFSLCILSSLSISLSPNLVSFDLDET